MSAHGEAPKQCQHPCRARQQVACSLPRCCAPFAHCMCQGRKALWHTGTGQQQVSSRLTSPPRQREQTLKQACFWGCPKSAVHVQVSIDSQSSAIHNAYRSLLRPSSLLKPRHPSLNVVCEEWLALVRAEAPARRWRGKRLAKRLGKEAARHPPGPSAREALPRQPQSFHPKTELHTRSRPQHCRLRVNDPSAGSPTETLLRLLLPLSDKVH